MVEKGIEMSFNANKDLEKIIEAKAFWIHFLVQFIRRQKNGLAGKKLNTKFVAPFQMTLHILCISSYNCRGNYSFLKSSSEETIQGEETNQGRKLYEEIR